MSSDEQHLLPPATDPGVTQVSDLLSSARRMLALGFFDEARRLCQQAAELGGPGAGEALVVMVEIIQAETRVVFEVGQPGSVRVLDVAPLEMVTFEPEPGAAMAEPVPASPAGRTTAWAELEVPAFQREPMDYGGMSLEEDYSAFLFHGIAAAPARAPRAEEPGVVARTPHLDVSATGPLAPGSTFAVTLRLDSLGFSADESGEQVIAPDGALLKIRLSATDHFELTQPEMALTLDARKARQHTDAVLVRVRELVEMEGRGAPTLSATFFFRGRPCGRVQRTLRIEGFKGVKPGRLRTARRRVPPRVAADTHAADADLTITITSAPENDGRRFECVIYSPLLPELSEGVSGPWNLPAAAADIVAREMTEFTTKLGGSDADKRELRVASLRGAGIAFYAGAPPIFKRVYGELRAKKLRPRHVAIVSDEPHIPWELMIPHGVQDGRRYRDDPLGVQCAIGRWITDDNIAAKQRLPLKDSSVFAPAYGGSRALPHAQAEARMVIEKFAPGASVEPADFGGFHAMLRGPLGSVLHLACHGKDDRHIQAIELVDGSRLTSSQLSGLTGIEEAFGTRRPFVFLNACEVGRQEPALAGVRGFAKEFISLGASAVIAPLWSVKDTLAHEVATAFYGAVDAGNPVAFAGILSALRAKSYDPAIGEDSYAAYCFYGDPLATIQ